MASEHASGHASDRDEPIAEKQIDEFGRPIHGEQSVSPNLETDWHADERLADAAQQRAEQEAAKPHRDDDEHSQL